MPQGKGTYGSQVGRPPKKKGSLLYNDIQHQKKKITNARFIRSLD